MKNIHLNTIQSYYEIIAELPNRQAQVYKACVELMKKKKIATDRTIKEYLGFHDMNQVRPRINELIRSRKLVEADTVVCPLTNRKVRALAPVC